MITRISPGRSRKDIIATIPHCVQMIKEAYELSILKYKLGPAFVFSVATGPLSQSFVCRRGETGWTFLWLLLGVSDE
jgi:hypothetical protein